MDQYQTPRRKQRKNEQPFEHPQQKMRHEPIGRPDWRVVLFVLAVTAVVVAIFILSATSPVPASP